jgi:hypothetical protein
VLDEGVYYDHKLTKETSKNSYLRLFSGTVTVNVNNVIENHSLNRNALCDVSCKYLLLQGLNFGSLTSSFFFLFAL